MKPSDDDTDVSEGGEANFQMLQRENGRLHEQLRSSEELNVTLHSELDLTRSILKHKPAEQRNAADSKNINSGTDHVWLTQTFIEEWIDALSQT